MFSYQGERKEEGNGERGKEKGKQIRMRKRRKIRKNQKNGEIKGKERKMDMYEEREK